MYGLPRRVWLTRWQLCWQCRRWRTAGGSQPQVAVVGSGPAGFYTAQHLLKNHPSLKVDMYEKLPVPFGLVRFGVAPDHPEVKNCIHSFTQTAQGERFGFVGNVQVGRDVSVADLQQAYTAVVLCYGLSQDRRLGIPGEDLQNVLPARSFVGWYNGLPEDRELQVDLDTDTALVLGQGNVALDVARILLTPLDILAKTDMCERALSALSRSRVRRVVVVGRRGPLQVAFTIKELREMLTLPGCRTIIHPPDVQPISAVAQDLARPRRRLSELLYTAGVSPPEKYTNNWATATREWELQFLRSPTKILSAKGGKSVGSVQFTINHLEGEAMEDRRAVPTDKTDTLPCGLVLRSIGYSGVPIDDAVPFDAKRGLIPNVNGRVTGGKGVYCSGWISRGPAFVILGTMNDGFNTARLLLEDIASGALTSDPHGGKDAILASLQKKGVRTVSFKDWEKIDRVELLEGEGKGKPREKIQSIEKMLEIAWT